MKTICCFYLNSNLQFYKGNDDTENIMLLPSGWLHLDVSSRYAENLGIENCKIVEHNINRKLLSVNLKDTLKKSAALKKLRLVLKERVIVSKPLVLTWYPDSNDVCPSSIAKYFDTLGALVIQKLPEMKIIRTQPEHHLMPKVKFITKNASLQELEGITIDDFENVLGTAFLGLPW